MESRVVKSITCADPKNKMLLDQCEGTTVEAEWTETYLFQISFWNKLMETFRVLPISSLFNC